MDDKQDSNHFDRAAETWDEKPRRVRQAQDMIAAIRRTVLPAQNMDLLDFGCGTGLVSLPMHRHVRSILGIDSSPGMVEKFNEKVEKANLTNARAVHLDDWSREDRSFDLIISTMTLHHLEDPAKWIAKFSGMLKSDGQLALLDLDTEDGSFHDPGATGIHHYGFQRDTIRKWMGDAGLSEIQLQTACVIHKEQLDRDYTVFIASASRWS